MGKPTGNPFRPIPGLVPPLRVGHAEPAAALARRLEKVRDDDGGGIIVLYGPDGNGKTTLLGELKEQAARAKLRHLVLEGELMAGDVAALAQAVAPKKMLDLDNIKGLMGRVLGKTAGDEAQAPDTGMSIGDALREALRASPLVLVADDADGMPAELGRSLLQAAEECVANRLPLLVVLAGTPGLAAHLERMVPGAWGRSMQLRIGCLESDDAASNALAIPARNSGMPIDADALELLVRESRRHPAFIQLLGYDAWRVAHGRDGSQRISMEDAKKGIALMRQGLREVYGKRRAEMERRNLLAEAEALSRVVVDQKQGAPLTGEELVGAVEGVASANGHDTGTVIEELSRFGLIWPTPDQAWEPGIPLLCAFLASAEGKPAK